MLNDALLYVLETWVALAGLYVPSSVALRMPWAGAGDTCFPGHTPALAPHGDALGSTACAEDPASSLPPNLRPLQHLYDVGLKVLSAVASLKCMTPVFYCLVQGLSQEPL